MYRKLKWIAAMGVLAATAPCWTPEQVRHVVEAVPCPECEECLTLGDTVGDWVDDALGNDD